MKQTLRIKQFGAVLAISALAVTSTFAESRPRNESDWRDGNRRNERRDDRRDERRDVRRDEKRNLSAQGRVTNLHRHRDGYRVQLDRHSQWYYVPASAWRSRGRGLSIGVNVRFGGGYYDDGGYIYVSNADYYDDYGYSRGGGYVSGVVQRIDYRRDVIELRDERTGRRITVNARRADRNRRGIDVNDLRRGDYVEFEGQWRGNVFQAYRIDSLDSRR